MLFARAPRTRICRTEEKRTIRRRNQRGCCHVVTMGCGGRRSPKRKKKYHRRPPTTTAKITFFSLPAGFLFVGLCCDQPASINSYYFATTVIYTIIGTSFRNLNLLHPLSQNQHLPTSKILYTIEKMIAAPSPASAALLLRRTASMSMLRSSSCSIAAAAATARVAATRRVAASTWCYHHHRRTASRCSSDRNSSKHQQLHHHLALPTSSSGASTQAVRLTSQQRRDFTFSFAGPRKLNDILKLDSIKDKSGTDIEDMWYRYHETKVRGAM